MQAREHKLHVATAPFMSRQGAMVGSALKLGRGSVETEEDHRWCVQGR